MDLVLCEKRQFGLYGHVSADLPFPSLQLSIAQKGDHKKNADKRSVDHMVIAFTF